MVSTVGLRSQLQVQSLVDMRKQLEDLQRQLGTGKKSTTYAGLGIDRGLTVGLRSQLSALTGFAASMQTVSLRLDIAQPVLTRFTEITSEVKSDSQQASPIKTTGQTQAQESARLKLDELVDLLNTRADGRHIFAGREVEAPPVVSSDTILNGNGAQAGLKTLIQERTAADRGADGLGRLVIPAAAGTAVSVSEDVDGSPFGYKLVSAGTTLSGATVTGPAGTPPDITVTLGATNPNPAENVTFTLRLPDGSEEKITLTAVTGAAGDGQFQIGPDSTATAANLQAALRGEVAKMSDRALGAASAFAAADDFFNIGPGDPPQRVDGPPFDTATGLIDGTPANTVTWYTGEQSTESARSSALAKVDDSITVAYGMRADEEGIRWLVQNVAAFAAVSFSASDTAAVDRYTALSQRTAKALSYPTGTQRIEDIAAELANVQVTMEKTEERHTQVKHTLNTLLDGVEGVTNEEVAAQILALDTRLQASLQTTAMLYQISLVNYL